MPRRVTVGNVIFKLSEKALLEQKSYSDWWMYWKGPFYNSYYVLLELEAIRGSQYEWTDLFEFIFFHSKCLPKETCSCYNVLLELEAMRGGRNELTGLLKLRVQVLQMSAGNDVVCSLKIIFDWIFLSFLVAASIPHSCLKGHQVRETVVGKYPLLEIK